MQTAHIILALGGDVGNTVPKYFVTPSEVAVLREIHGNESVNDIDVNGDVQRTNRVERERLAQFYGKPQPDGSFRSDVVNALFPGVAARLYEKFDELELDEMFFKTKAPAPVEKTVKAEEPEADLSKLKKADLVKIAAQRGIEVSPEDTKAEILAAIEAQPDDPAEVDEDDEDDIDDMPSETNLFK